MSETPLPANFWTAEITIDPFAMNPDAGADLALIEAHESELETIVHQMWKDMTTEQKVLDGTELPDREEIVVPRVSDEIFQAWLHAETLENEPPSTEEDDSKE